jgi:hypothetical protein
LTGVTIPKGVTIIEYMAFANNQLASVTIPDGVTTIGGYVFSDNQLTGITIPDNVTEITDYIFSGNQLTGITIGSNVTIRNGHFGNDFAEYYDSNGKQAGTYAFANGQWGAVYR